MKLEQLYRQVVLERSRRPRFQGELPGVTHREGGYNASGGDRLALQLRCCARQSQHPSPASTAAWQCSVACQWAEDEPPIW